jgi:hypothetical protein
MYIRNCYLPGYFSVWALQLREQPSSTRNDLWQWLTCKHRATMVTAILPTMTLTKSSQDPRVTQPPNGTSHAATPSISSELTITPARLQSHSPQPPLSTKGDSAASASRLAGVVGSFTGCGALVALLVFLPLPTVFQRRGHSPATAVADAFYVVGAIALLVAAAVFLGLRNLPGEEGKGPRRLLRYSTPKEGEGHTPVQTVLSLPRQFLASIALGLKSRNIGLAYLGGFVARSSSVAISLYIPLFTYNYFLRTGQCSADPQDPLDVKLSCARAYKLAAALTGVSQFIALVAAPLFGFISARYPRFNIPLLSSALAGVVGYSVFGALDSPDPRSTEGSGAVFLVVSLLGFSQIGAIVCSLGLLARGIHSDGEIDAAPEPQRYFHSEGHHQSRDATPSVTPATEEAPLLADPLRPRHTSPAATDLNHLKGSIAGTYSLFGGVGILILTKAGGALFDSEGPGSPFFMMASFNAVLLVVGAALAIYEFIRDRSASSQHSV